MTHYTNIRKPILMLIFGVIILILITFMSVACGLGHRSVRNNSIDNRTILSNSGVKVRVFDENGNAINNPSEQYKLDITQSGKIRQVVVSLKREISTRSNYLEVRFDGTRLYPTDIQTGSALMQHKPLVYTGSPESGMVICAQVIPSQKKFKVNGELLRLDFVAGSHQVRTVSAFNQDPTKDPIIANTSADPIEKNKIYWTIKLRGEGNNNQLFDFADFGIVGARYGALASEAGCEVADADGKGKVDFADFGIIGANYNKGIGGLKLWRDDKTNPSTLLGILDTSGKIKGDFSIEKTANKPLLSGFKQYWYTCSGSGQYIKMALLDVNGFDVSGHVKVVDTLFGQGDWYMFGRVPTHNRRSPFYGPTTNALKWTFKTDGPIMSSSAIGVEGTIYVGSDDFHIYAVNPNGTIKWKFKTGAKVSCSPAIGTDGTVYVGSYDNNLYALNSNGTEKWIFKTGNWVYSSPAIGSDGTVYFGSHDKYLYALNSNGTEKWKFKTSETVLSSPAIGPDGTVYVGSHDNYLYAINPNGTEKWKFKTQDWVYSSPAIDENGVVYVGSFDSYIYAVNPDGSEKWKFKTGMTINNSPAIGPDGTVYIGSQDTYLYAVNPDGSEKWKFKTGGEVSSSPAISFDGTIYVGSDNLYAIKPVGNLKWYHTTGGIIYSSPVIGSDGTIFVGCFDGKLYAIGPGEGK